MPRERTDGDGELGLSSFADESDVAERADWQRIEPDILEEEFVAEIVTHTDAPALRSAPHTVADSGIDDASPPVAADTPLRGARP